MVRLRRALVAGLVVVLAAGCGGHSSKKGRAFQRRFSESDSARVTNAWFPLRPGTTFVYRGTKDGKPARDVVTVTSRTKRILGVSSAVVHDRLFVGGQLAEETFDWYAQDKAGNVWYVGEATEELAHGKVTSREGSWQAGVGGADAGMIMQAHPRVGDAYRQEYLKGQAEDHAQVLSLSASVRVPAGSYSNVQLTKEWTPLEPDVLDHKFYARGVGLVKEVTVRGPRESAVLVSVR